MRQDAGLTCDALAGLLLRAPLGVAGGQVDQVHEQPEKQRTHRPLDAMHGGVRFEPEAQFLPQEGEAVGRVGGVGFHVCWEHMHDMSRCQGLFSERLRYSGDGRVSTVFCAATEA